MLPVSGVPLEVCPFHHPHHTNLQPQSTTWHTLPSSLLPSPPSPPPFQNRPEWHRNIEAAIQHYSVSKGRQPAISVVDTHGKFTVQLTYGKLGRGGRGNLHTYLTPMCTPAHAPSLSPHLHTCTHFLTLPSPTHLHTLPHSPLIYTPAHTPSLSPHLHTLPHSPLTCTPAHTPSLSPHSFRETCSQGSEDCALPSSQTGRREGHSTRRQGE